MFTFLILFQTSLLSASAVHPFEKIQPYWISGTEGDRVSDLSGLAICDGKLLTISDKINDTVFEITINNDNARITEAASILTIPPISAGYHFPNNFILWGDTILHPGKMDWEAITCSNSTTYLLSEELNAILKIANSKSEWLATDWYTPAFKLGYLNKFNGFVEGLVVLSPTHFIVAIEREPRGILEITRHKHAWEYSARALPNDAPMNFQGRPEDLSDIAEYHGILFTLERNAAAVCARDIISLKSLSCYSFKAIEDDPQYQYIDQRFGMAEGLAISDNWIYIIYDNNKVARRVDRGDHRTLLLRIPTPTEWRELELSKQSTWNDAVAHRSVSIYFRLEPTSLD